MKYQILLFALFVILIPSYLIGSCTSLSRDKIISSFGTISYPNVITNSFGVHVWWYSNLTYQMEKVAELGVGWIRIDAWWPGLEPEQGQYNFDMMDTMVSLAKSYGIKPLLVVNNVPDWANGGQGEKAPPTDVNCFKDIVKVLVDRYNLEIIELYQEPEYEFSGTEQQYVDLIHAGYDGAKEANPACIVISGYAGGEITQIYRDRGSYSLDSLVNKGLLSYIDGLVVHPYTWTTPPEDIIPSDVRTLKGYLESKGYGNLPLYNTEFGYATSRHSLEEQANWTVRACEICKDLFEINIYYCFWSNNRTPPNGGAFWALVSDDALTPRPVYFAYQEFIRNL